MPIPHPTTRRLMVATAIVAVELGFFANFEGGLPANLNGLIAVNIPWAWLALLQMSAPSKPGRH